MHATGLRRVLLPVLTIALLLIAGCDFGADDETITVTDEVVFRFTFEADDVNVGDEVEVESLGTESVRSTLSAQGYELDEIISARAIGGIAEVFFPLDAAISFLDRLTVSLVADTTVSDAAAQQLSIPVDTTDDQIDLTANPGVDIGPQLRADSFRGRLVLVANDGLRPGESYEIAVQLQLSMEVLFQ